MNLSFVRELFFVPDQFAFIRTKSPGRPERGAPSAAQKILHPKDEKAKQQEERHLTPEQQGEISSGLQDSVTGPVSMTASPTDQEAVGYEREIAHVLWETGFKVEIDNTQEEAQELPAGVEMTIKDGTIRPVHAYPIFRAFRSVGIAIATRINRKRRKNTTVYLTVGPKDAPAPVPPTSGTSKLR